MRRALITGITGQDGSYLADLLLLNGYEVHGTLRDRSHLGNIGSIASRLHLHPLDLTDDAAVVRLIRDVEPNEFYQLAAPSFVSASNENPRQASDVIARSTLVILEAIRQSNQPIRFVQASSSEIFGFRSQAILDESGPFFPQNLYASAKLYAHNIVGNYRSTFDLFACSAILFNHDSPRRGLPFVTRKITHGVAKIHAGLQEKLVLGDLQAVRDFGFAGDFVIALWKMLQVDSPEDYVIGTGRLTKIETFVERAFQRVGLNWRHHVEMDPTLFRRGDEKKLAANSSRALERLEWRPTTSVESLIDMMVDYDLELIQAQRRNRQAA